MAHARDAETIGLLFMALVQHHCPTVSLLAQRLGAPYGPPLLVAIGVTDDPRSRWLKSRDWSVGCSWRRRRLNRRAIGARPGR